MFSKQSFDVLPEPKECDHAVELIPGSTPSGCKVYPLSPAEQKELDVFLKENLETGRIRPSKSLILSPVFFIKKKDSSLRLVQDYRALNAVTVKNKLLSYDFPGSFRNGKYAENNSGQERTKSGMLPVTDKDFVRATGSWT